MAIKHYGLKDLRYLGELKIKNGLILHHFTKANNLGLFTLFSVEKTRE